MKKDSVQVKHLRSHSDGFWLHQVASKWGLNLQCQIDSKLNQGRQWEMAAFGLTSHPLSIIQGPVP